MRKLTTREVASRGCKYCAYSILTGSNQNSVTCQFNKCLFTELDNTSWRRVERMERNSFDPYYRKHARRNFKNGEDN